VAWAIRESGSHALAGIWHEGTNLAQAAATGIRRVESGRRQYALFAGLNVEGSACGHVSENGSGSFLNQYALHKCNSGDVSPAVPADSDPETLDRSWHAFAMTFDSGTQEITGWLDGKSTERWLENPGRDKLLASVENAWRQAHLRRMPGLQPGEDPSFPAEQFFTPPEEAPLAVKTISVAKDFRIEARHYQYTRVRVTLVRARDGRFREVKRDLEALKLNPWWYPHGIYAPNDPETGGPFTIGRVIHSARGVGFTGWIGGVAVFNRALSADEMSMLARVARERPIELAEAMAPGQPPEELGGQKLATIPATISPEDAGYP
jgi:hypothetical protein